MRALIILLYLVGLGISSWWVECKVLDHCNPWVKPTIETPADPLARLTDLALHKSGQLPLNGYEQFAFDANSSKPNLSANNNKFITDLERYMKKNPEETVNITGYYLKSENYKGSLANLGVARAAAVRDILVKKGINAKRIGLAGQLLGKGADLRKPLRFDAILKEKGKKELAVVTQTFEDRTYYFQYSSDNWEPTAEFKRYTGDLVKYLAENKGKRVEVIGHTDSDGSYESNMQLGRNRAREIRKYLISSGIPANKITIDSKGENQPAHSTDKAQNRRVNVKIK